MRVPTHSLALTALLVTGAVLGYNVAPGAPGARTAAPADATTTPASVPATAHQAAPRATDAVQASPPSPMPDADAEGAPYYAEGQFTARFDQTHNTWRLQPIDGPDLVIDAGACSTGATAPAGVWLLVLTGDGRAELVAPSATPLAAGEPGRIALRACDQASGRELAVPQTVLDLLATGTGAIYVDR